jgi:hypothetical protein
MRSVARCGVARCGVAQLLFLAALLHSVEALDINRTVPIHCKGRFDTSSSAMFNLAYEWTRHSKLHEWSYNTIGRECALVSYTTQIRLKHVFQQLIPSRALHAKITKHACVRGDRLFETINLSELLLIERMEIKIGAEIDHATDSLLMHAYSDVVVPWLLQIFEKTILMQIEDSFREYQDHLARSVCK